MLKPTQLFIILLFPLLYACSSTQQLQVDVEDGQLQKVIRGKDYDAIQTILQEEKTDINASCTGYEPALFEAIQQGDAFIIKLLLDQGASLAVRDKSGDTPLINVLRRRLPFFNMLLERGADPNATAQDGKTPLMIAAETGQERAVGALIGRGADTTPAVQGKDARTLAEENGHKAILLLFTTDNNTTRTEDTFATAFSEATAFGFSEQDAVTFAKCVDEQVKKGQSINNAQAQAIQLVTSPEDNVLANQQPDKQGILGAIRAKMVREKGEVFAQKYMETYKSQLKEGKSQIWAHAFASQIARKKNNAYASCFAQQRIKGKSFDWAKAYASAIERKESPEIATQVANYYQEQRVANKSQGWAWKYAFQRAKFRKSHDEAAAYANKKTKGIQRTRRVLSVDQEPVPETKF